jgi:hypothetical protein
VFSLPTRSRPHNLARFIEAYRETEASHPVWLRLDDCDPHLADYDAIPLPDHWLKTVGPRLPNRCNGAVAEMFNLFPNEPVYGLLADDLIPRTKHWDQKLIEAAGDSRLAYGDDGFMGEGLATHPVIGGELARAIGWLVLPGVLHSFVDTALFTIALRAKRLVYLPEVKVEHMHPLAKKAPEDEIHRFRETYVPDQAVFYRWQGTELRPIVDRVKARFEQKAAA